MNRFLSRPQTLAAAALCLAGFGTMICSCPAALAADSIHEMRSVDASFNSIKLDGPVDVLVLQGATASVAVDAPASLAAEIHTKVENGTLNIESNGLSHLLHFGFLHEAHWVVTVTMPTLRQITMDGSGDLKVQRLTSSDELVLRLRGSGDVDLEQIKVGKLTTEISGSADVQASGSALEQSVKIAGSGDYNGNNLKGDSVGVAIAGSGDAAVWASKSLAIQIAGSGDVVYWGDPTVSKSIEGSGEVTHGGSKS